MFRKILQRSTARAEQTAELQQFKTLIERLNPIVEFDLEGRVISANMMFQKLSGYSMAELSRMTYQQLYQSSFSNDDEYRSFWRKICQGDSVLSHYQLRAKASNLWVGASVFPLQDDTGTTVKVLLVNIDVTPLAHTADMVLQAKLDAFDRSNAIIEFSPAGEVLTANQNFLDTMGYRLNEVLGKHHSIFCEAEYTNSKDYQQFWHRLASGEYLQDRFKRINRQGQVIWLEATYNPVFDQKGKVIKVVKLATDVTAAVNRSEQEAQSASRAYHIAAETEKVAEHGTEVIQNAAQEMKNIADTIRESAHVVAELGRQSEQITAIVNTIRGIADQTNLLALNAAIEAARAGDQGRGFAVVADEVRQLAGRTSQSTQEISAMIDKIQTGTETAVSSMSRCQSQAEHGVDLAGQAGAVIVQIRDGAKDAVEAVSMFADVLDERDVMSS